MQPDVAPSRRVKTIQRQTLILLVICVSISTIDRAALAVANPLVRHDLGLSVSEMGLLLSAFLWAYAVAQLPIGPLIDRFGPRRVLAAGITVWSTAQMLCGAATGTLAFAGARALLGVGEAPQFPTAACAAKDWFAVRDRGRATGWFMCASYLGTGIAAPLITGLMLTFGWRWMFVIMGVLGLVVALVWAMKYRGPQEVALGDDERAYFGTPQGRAAGAQRVSLRQWASLFKSGTTWGMLAGYFGIIYVNWLFNTWLPGYLHMQRHMSLVQVGWMAAIPYSCAVVGAITAGYLVDWLSKRGASLTASRKAPACVFLVVQTLLVTCAVSSTSNSIAIACLSGAMFCGTAATTIAWAMVSVFAPSTCTGSLGSLQNFGGYVGGACAPIVTGLIVQKTGSFDLALYIGAGMSLLAALAYLTLVKGKIAVEEHEETPVLVE